MTNPPALINATTRVGSTTTAPTIKPTELLNHVQHESGCSHGDAEPPPPQTTLVFVDSFQLASDKGHPPRR
jgi:hypothetical protein